MCGRIVVNDGWLRRRRRNERRCRGGIETDDFTI